MNIKEIKRILKNIHGVEFRINRSGHHFDGIYDVFETHKSKGDKEVGSIHKLLNGMNIKKFGPTCITLYSFDMMGNKTTGKIRYDEVEIISIPSRKRK